MGLKRILEIAEAMGWEYVADPSDDTIEFYQHSPAGEDFHFVVDKKNAKNAICTYADDFDTEEHIEMWVLAKIEGRSGVPSIRELVADADEIKKMLTTFANAIDSVGEVKKYHLTMERTVRVGVEFTAENEDAAVVEANRLYNMAMNNPETGFAGGDVEGDFALCDEVDRTIVDWG